MESRIREIGLELYRAVNETPPVFDRRRWVGRITDWAMKDEEFRLGLFRYIDVLPSLKNDSLVLKLLNEYFPDPEKIPLLMRQGLKHSSRGLLPHAAAAFIRAAVEKLAGDFIAGRNAEEAVGGGVPAPHQAPRPGVGLLERKPPPRKNR